MRKSRILDCNWENPPGRGKTKYHKLFSELHMCALVYVHATPPLISKCKTFKNTLRPHHFHGVLNRNHGIYPFHLQIIVKIYIPQRRTRSNLFHIISRVWITVAGKLVFVLENSQRCLQRVEHRLGKYQKQKRKLACSQPLLKH